MSEATPSIYKRHPREDGSTFVTCPDFPLFSFILEPGEDDARMNAIFVQYVAYNIEGLAALTDAKR